MNHQETIMCGVLIAATLHAGCAAVPDTRPLHQTPEQMATLGRVGFVTGRFEPAVDMQFDPGAKAKAGRRGALASVECLRLLSGDPLLTPIGLVLVLPCMPILALVGAAANASDVPGAGAVTSAESAVQEVLSSKVIHDGLRETLTRYAAGQQLNAVLLPSEAGPVSADAMPAYGEDVQQLADTVLEVSALRLTAKSLAAQDQVFAWLEVPVRVRLVATRDNRVLDTYVFTHRSRARTADEWRAAGAKALGEALTTAYREVAEEVIDESLLIRRAAVSTASGATRSAGGRTGGLVPDYVLQPLFPHASREIGGGFTRRARIDTLQPTLRWEPFPRHHADLAGGRAPAGSVTYEVRIYDSEIWRKGRLGFADTARPVAEIYRRAGLTGTEHTVETPLLPCRIYFWSVRARYEINGRPWVTEWSGAYWTVDGENAPWLWRRSTKQPSLIQQPNSFSFLPFETTSRDQCAAG